MNDAIIKRCVYADGAGLCCKESSPCFGKLCLLCVNYAEAAIQGEEDKQCYTD